MRRQCIAVICADRTQFEQYLRNNGLKRETPECLHVSVQSVDNARGYRFDAFREYGPQTEAMKQAKGHILLYRM